MLRHIKISEQLAIFLKIGEASFWIHVKAGLLLKTVKGYDLSQQAIFCANPSSKFISSQFGNF